jgi:hypothetical protein
VLICKKSDKISQDKYKIEIAQAAEKDIRDAFFHDLIALPPIPPTPLVF